MTPHMLYHHWRPEEIVMQADDEYFDEIDDCFKPIPAGWVKETYGIEKPDKITDDEFMLIGYRCRNDYIRSAP